MPSLQIRNVPDDVHRRLRSRAALAGQSLAEYALSELTRSLERPTRAEMLERLRQRDPVVLSESAASLVRQERDSR